MRLLLNLCFTLFAVASYCAEYTVSLLETDKVEGYKQWNVTGINDNGTAFGAYQEAIDNQYVSRVYLYDVQAGFTFIDSEDKWLFPVAANNAGQLIGYGQKPFFWSKELGFRYLNVFDSANVQVADLNDQGQVIGSYFSTETNLERPFIWENGVTTYLGPGSEFTTALEAFDPVMGVTLMSINNKGQIAGCYHYAKFNERQQKYVSVGYKAFLWDHGKVTQIPVPTPLTQLPYKMKVNNQGVVLLRTDKDTYLWNPKKGIQLLAEFNGIALNDSSIVLGFKRISPKKAKDFEPIENNEVPAIWRKDKIITLAKLLDVDDMTAMARPYNDKYAVERLETILDINNKGQIIGTGMVWGECHPCLLEPKR